MSIARLMQDEAAIEASRQRRRRGSRRGPEGNGADETTLSKLTKYIPTEAVALYVAILPFLVPDDVALNAQDYTTRWFLAVGVGVMALLFAVGVYRQALIARGGQFSWPPRITSTVLLAYAAWVIAVPGSPMNDFDWYSPSLGAIVAIIMSALIALMHLWFGEPEK